MKEYTLLCIIFLVALFFADTFLKNRVGGRRAFFYALAFSLLTQLIVDNFTAWLGFWSFNEETMMGIRVPVIPFENLLFGIALFYASIISWEFNSKKGMLQKAVSRG
jgi:lycopene cyclase domain-containing protein